MKYYLAIEIGASSGRHIVGWKENGSTFNILCDRDDPEKFCVKTVSLVNSIIMFGIMFVLQAGTLGLTVYLIKELGQ